MAEDRKWVIWRCPNDPSHDIGGTLEDREDAECSMCRVGTVMERVVVVPEPDTFHDLLAVARRIVNERYPEDVFTVTYDDGRDPGVQLVAAIRACDRAMTGGGR